MPVYIEEINSDVNRLTDQKGKCSAICLFESKKIEKRQRFAISHTIVLIVLASVDKHKVFFFQPNFHRPSPSSLNPFEQPFTSNQSLDSLVLPTSRPILYKFSIQNTSWVLVWRLHACTCSMMQRSPLVCHISAWWTPRPPETSGVYWTESSAEKKMILIDC